MTENMLDMSASAKAAETPQNEQEHDAKHGEEQLPPALTRPSDEELEVARELVRSARERGTALTGPGGLLKGVDQDGDRDRAGRGDGRPPRYDKLDAVGRGSGNSHNGTRTKTVLTDNCGPVEIEDRCGFQPTRN